MRCIVSSREGPFTLLHRPSGAIYLFTHPQDVVDGLKKLGVRRLVGRVRPDWFDYAANPRVALGYLRWQLTNVYGEVVVFDDLAPWMPVEVSWRTQRYGGERARFRRDPVPGTACRTRRKYWREIPSGALAREVGALDEGPPPREARYRWAMPSLVWDDRVRRVERNWKSQRRTQWKKGATRR